MLYHTGKHGFGMQFVLRKLNHTKMFIFYIVLGAFAIGAGAVASANLSETPRRR